MRIIKKLPNIITSIRIILAPILLALEPLSLTFMSCYIICGISDIADGFLARKMKCTSKNGALLDSIADVIFIFSLIISLIPVVNITKWMLIWVMIIIIIRLVSLIIGFIKYKTLTFLHTYSNKATGLLLFCTPFLMFALEFKIAVCFLCVAATLSAIEEMIINIMSTELLRDVKNIFSILH